MGLSKRSSPPLAAPMTVIEIKPHAWGWKVFEAPGVEPVFPEKRHGIDYAETRACLDEVIGLLEFSS